MLKIKMGSAHRSSQLPTIAESIPPLSFGIPLTFTRHLSHSVANLQKRMNPRPKSSHFDKRKQEERQEGIYDAYI